MKFAIMFVLMSSFMGSMAFAAESETECIMMKEDTERKNPKIDLEITKPQPIQTRGSSAQ